MIKHAWENGSTQLHSQADHTNVLPALVKFVRKMPQLLVGFGKRALASNAPAATTVPAQ